MSDPATAKKPYNIIVRSGVWIAAGAGLVWLGGETYKVIQAYVPWVLGLGIALLAVGLVLQFKGPKPSGE